MGSGYVGFGMLATWFKDRISSNRTILLTGLFVGSIFSSVDYSHADEQHKNASFPASPTKDQPPSHSENWHARNGVRIQRNWGVDIVGVRPTSSGFMLAFRYRIVDSEKAKLLNDKRSKAYLIDEVTGNTLGVPIMDNLGELRQNEAPVLNRTYFIMFGNPGKLVKSGGLVDVVIGEFRVNGLIVD